VCDHPIDLGERGTLTVRHACGGDELELGALYDRLEPADLMTRFFTAGRPGRHFLEGWVSVAARGGLCLLVGLENSEGRRVVAEAGFAPLIDGDVELGITVDPEHRGWVGPWLLDQLLAHASAAGIDNMQALVKTRNRPMLDLIKHRGCAWFDETDWETTRVTMATSGHTPSWPPEAKSPRVLVESPRSRPDVARRVRQGSGTTLICTGFDQAGSHCPLHEGEPCPLIAGADVVVLDGQPWPLDPDAHHPDTSRSNVLKQTILDVHPDAHVVAVEIATTAGLPHRDSTIDLGLATGVAEDRQTNEVPDDKGTT